MHREPFDKKSENISHSLALPIIPLKNNNNTPKKKSIKIEKAVSFNNKYFYINTQKSLTINDTNVNNNIIQDKSSFKLKKDQLKLPLLKSPGYNKIYKTENMKSLAKDYIRKNNDIFHYIKEAKNDFLLKTINKRLETNEQDPDNIYGNKIQSMVRLHSSNYHSEKEENNKSLDDEFDEVMKQLKNKKKLKPWDINNEKINIKDENNNILKYRKRMAFKYRYLSLNKKKKSKKKYTKLLNIKNNNEKIKKILKISKSIPNYLLQKIIVSERNKSEGGGKDIGILDGLCSNKSSNIDKSINLSSIYSDKDNDNNDMYIFNNPHIYKNYFHKNYNSFDIYNYFNLPKKNDEYLISDINNTKNIYYDNNDIFKITKIDYSYNKKIDKNELKNLLKIEKNGNKYLKHLSILLS